MLKTKKKNSKMIVVLALVLAFANISCVFADTAGSAANSATVVIDDMSNNADIVSRGNNPPTATVNLANKSLNCNATFYEYVYSNYKFKPVNGKISIDGRIDPNGPMPSCHYNIYLDEAGLFGSSTLVYSKDVGYDTAHIDKTVTGLNDDHYYYLYISKSSTPQKTTSTLSLTVSGQ